MSDDPDFKYIIRIANSDVSGEERLAYALTSIRGIGLRISNAIINKLNLDLILGHLTTAISDNEIRVEYLGYSVEKAIHIKYVISACLAGGAGGLMAASLGQVDPDSMVLWSVSGCLLYTSPSPRD